MSEHSDRFGVEAWVVSFLECEDGVEAVLSVEKVAEDVVFFECWIVIRQSMITVIGVQDGDSIAGERILFAFETASDRIDSRIDISMIEDGNREWPVTNWNI